MTLLTPLFSSLTLLYILVTLVTLLLTLLTPFLTLLTLQNILLKSLPLLTSYPTSDSTDSAIVYTDYTDSDIGSTGSTDSTIDYSWLNCLKGGFYESPDSTADNTNSPDSSFDSIDSTSDSTGPTEIFSLLNPLIII